MNIKATVAECNSSTSLGITILNLGTSCRLESWSWGDAATSASPRKGCATGRRVTRVAAHSLRTPVSRKLECKVTGPRPSHVRRYWAFLKGWQWAFLADTDRPLRGHLLFFHLSGCARLTGARNVLRLQEPKNEQRRLKERETPPASRAAEDCESTERTETPPITPDSKKQRFKL